MATKSINKEVANQYTKNKKYVYSWLDDGAGATDYIISDRLSTLNFDVGMDGTLVGKERQDITLVDGNSNAYLKTVAAGYLTVEKNTGSTEIKEVNYTAPKSLTVSGVDTGAIYGGVIVTTNKNYSSIYYSTYSSSTSRYENVNAIVDGGSNITVSTVKATAVYGGGAGYGSILNGDVKIAIKGTNTISNVYGGGQKGAVVNGDVNIDIDRTDARSGRIGYVYGGGDNATVNGDVNITVHGVNALAIGTISGSGKGTKAQVTGTRTLTIADYSGVFSTTIKDFDKIIFESGTAVTLKQTQQKSIMSAKYEFIIDEASINQKDAMLTWDKNINVAEFQITIDSDFASNVDDPFTTTIYSSSYLTQAAFDKAGMKIYDEDGNEITSGYTLKFVADQDSKGNNKTKGGSVILEFAGTKAEMTVDSTDTELTAADDNVAIKGGLVRASLDTKGGDDKVTIQTNTRMAGDIALGTGDNTVRVQGDAEITGSIIAADGTAEKHTTNTIYVNGSISQIEGGNEYTDNFVYINTPNAVGYYKNSAASNDLDAEGNLQRFIPQALVFSGKSNDTVFLSEVATGIPAISFGQGADTLVLNTSLTAEAADTRITADDGNDVIVANQTGITIDANKLKLAGTDNIFVVTNGVRAAVNGVALGAFESQYSGIYLGQNALVDVNGELAVQSYDGDLYLTSDMTVLTAPTASEELAARIGTYYTVGTGVNANIQTNGNNITVREGASVNGTIIGATEVYFKGTAGGEELYFDNDGAANAATIKVAKNAVATVASINGIAGTTYEGADDFENDSAQVTLNENAALYAAQDKNLLVGNITTDTDFTAKYGDKAAGTISVIDVVKAGVKFTDATVYFGGKADFEGGIEFAGKNTVAVNSAKIVLDAKKQIFFADANASVDFNVQDGAELAFDGIEKGGTYSDQIKVNLGKNARFAMGDTLRTASWSEEFNNAMLDGRTNVTFDEGSLIDNTINLKDATSDLTINISKDAVVKGDLGNLADEDKGVVRLGKGEDTLNVAAATVDGTIYSANDAATNKDVINLAGSTVNGMKAPLDELAVRINGEDELNLTAKAKVNGDIEALGNSDVNVLEESVVTGSIIGGDEVYVKDSTVEGSINAANGVLNNAKVGSIVGGTTFVESGSTTEKNTSEIGTVDATNDDVTLYADVATANIAALKGAKDSGKTLTLDARNGGTIALKGIDGEQGTAVFKAYHAGSAVDFGGDVKLVANNVTFSAVEGGALQNLGNVEVAGGMANVDARTLTGELTTATSATIESVKGAAVTTGDIKFVADDSAISIESEGTANKFGTILQSGKISQEAYARKTTYDQATSATIELKKHETFTTDSSIEAGAITQYAKTATVNVAGGLKVNGAIEQTADTATVQVEGTAEIAGDVVQNEAATAAVGFKGTANVTGAVKQDADDATFAVEGAAVVAGGVEQKATNTAIALVQGTLDAAVTQKAASTGVAVAAKIAGAIDQSYTTEPFSAELAAINFDKVDRSVGAVTQTGDENTVMIDATVQADGEYETGYHKAAQINIGSVALKAGAIEQTGDKNTVTADIRYTADGESDVVIGKTDFEIGAIKQLSDEGTSNTVSVTTSQTIADDQSVMKLGDIAGKVGDISQKAYKASNEVTINMAKSADEDLAALNVTAEAGKIEMLAYGTGANNTLTLGGKVTVTGDVKVGGVIEDEHISKDSAWGDRTADTNTVTIATDTVELKKDLSLVGLTNNLTLNNDAYFKGATETKQVAQNVSLAGKTNTIDLAAGLKMDNVKLYDLEDHDKIGKDGYDLTDDGVYTNNLYLRGEVASLELKQKNSSDNIYLYGGKVAGNVVTNNGDDTLVLGNDGKVIDGAARVMGDATVGGDVTMGTQGAADGTNTIAMEAFAARDLANPDADVAHSVAIVGKVEMAAGGEGAFNSLTMAGKGVENAETGLTTVGTASIGGAVAMDAVSFDENGDVRTDSTNTIAMGPMSTIGGDVTMKAFDENRITVEASEEIVREADVNAFADIKGKVTMQADDNAITVGAAAGAKPGDAQGAAAYMDGIAMKNVYAENGAEYLTDGSMTNTIEVGATGVGSELIVGKSASELADVSMGSIAFKNEDAKKTNFILDSVEIAERGHDVLKYHGEKDALVAGITASNTINVTGRFAAKDITMLGSENAIGITGDGSLAKGDKSSDDVRTALFNAAAIAQVGVTSNSVSAYGENYVSHKDADGVEVGKLASVEFNSGDISQLQFGDGSTTSNTVSFTNSVIATTGNITQLGKGDNGVTVESYVNTENYPLGAPRSSVGNIAQGEAEFLGANNTVTLTTADAGNIAQFASVDNTVTLNSTTLDSGLTVGSLAGTINQTATEDNTVALYESESGTITQTAGVDNTVTLATSTSGAITQTAGNKNYVGASGTPVVDNYQTSEILGGITQTSTAAYDSVEGENTTNEVDATDTNIAGNITQTGFDSNEISVSGSTLEVTFEGGKGGQTSYWKQYDVEVAGNIQQTGRYNDIDLENVKGVGTITQDGATSNDLYLEAYVESKGAALAGEGEACEYNGDATHGSDKTHANESVLFNPEGFNTQTVGDIKQTVKRPESNEIDHSDHENYVYAYNYNVGNVTQNNDYGNNVFGAENAVTVTKFGNYVGEKDLELNDVNKVESYEVNTGFTLKDVAQTASSNEIWLEGVAGGTLTQTVVSAEDYQGDSDAPYRYNAIKTYAADDVLGVVVDTVKWDETVPGYDKEVFTPAILKGSNNVRVGNTLGAITQTSDASGNYAAADQAVNSIDLENTTVNGGDLAISQTGKALDANVKNTLTAATKKQDFVDVGTNAAGERVEVDYSRTTQDNINGSIEQEGFVNEATLTNVNVNCNITQTTNMIATTAHHGAQAAGVKVEGNTLTINAFNGTETVAKDAAVTETALELDNFKETGYAEKLNIVNVAVTGKVSQKVNNKLESRFTPDGTDNVTTVATTNSIHSDLANFGDIEQEITYGINTALLENTTALTGEAKTVLTAGNVTQKGSTNLFGAEVTAVKDIVQDAYEQDGYSKKDGFGDAVKNHVELVGSFNDDKSKYSSASADLIDQDVHNFATAEGRYDTANYQSPSNEAKLTNADVKVIKQGLASEGLVTNEVDFDSSDYAIVEGKEVRFNEIGEVTQFGIWNNVHGTNYKNVGSIDQTANPVAFETTVSPTEKGLANAENDVNISKTENVGKINQTAKSAEFVYSKEGQPDENKVSDGYNAVTLDTIKTAADINQKIVGEDGAEKIQLGNNQVTATNVEDGSNINQTAVRVDSSSGIANGIWTTDSNFDDVVQTSFIGENRIDMDSTAAEGEPKSAHTLGNVTQTGTLNRLDAETTTMKGVRQTAIAQEDKQNMIYNAVTLTGDVTNVVLDSEGKTVLTQPKYEKAGAEYIAQNVVNIATEVEGVKYYDLANQTYTSNYVALNNADVGAIKQGSQSEGIVRNVVYFDSTKMIAQYHDADETHTTAYIEKVTPKAELGNVHQDGFENQITGRNYAKVADLVQTAESVKTIETQDGTDTTTVTKSQVVYLDNNINLQMVKEVGNVTQTATSEQFEKVVEETDKATGVKTTTTSTEIAKAQNMAMFGNYSEMAAWEDGYKVGNVSQIVQDAAGAETKVAEGTNTLYAQNVSFGNIKQTTVKGSNWTQIGAVSVPNETNGDYVKMTAGTIDQTGNRLNSLSADVTEMGAVKQNGVALATTDELNNTAYVRGVVTTAEAIKADPDDANKVTGVRQQYATQSKVESITQVTTSFKAGTAETVAGDFYDVTTPLANNDVHVVLSSVGAISQTGTGSVYNYVFAEGQALETYKVNATEDGIELDTSVAPTLVHTVGQIDQVGGYYNQVDVHAVEAADINQTAESYATIEFASDYAETQKYETGKSTSGLYNSVWASGLTTVGTVTQEVKSEEVQFQKYIGQTADGDPTVGYVNGSNFFTAETGAQVAKVVQKGADWNEVEVGDEGTLVSAIEQTGAYAGMFSYAENYLNVFDGATVGTIVQTALGERTYSEDGKTITNDIWGENYVNIGYEDGNPASGANVTGLIKQVASGLEAYNGVDAQGDYTASEIDMDGAGVYTATNGTFDNAIADVEQTLDNYQTLTQFQTNGYADNYIGLGNMNAGNLVQNTTHTVDDGGNLKTVSTYTKNSVWSWTDSKLDPDNEGAGVNMYTYDYTDDTHTAVKYTGQMRTTIGTITQTGYDNEIDIGFAKIGDITVRGTLVENEEEAPDGSKIYTWDSSRNYIELFATDVANITAITDVMYTRASGMFEYGVSAADTEIYIGGTATYGAGDSSTVGNITTGAGDDLINFENYTTVTGTINTGNVAITEYKGGSVSQDWDKIYISSATSVDLSKATIENVEELGFMAWNDGSKMWVDVSDAALTVNTLTLDDITLNNVSALNVTTLTVDKIADSHGAFESGALKTIGAAGDLSTAAAVNLTFNEGVGYRDENGTVGTADDIDHGASVNKLVGSTSKTEGVYNTDKLTIGNDDNVKKVYLDNVTVSDFENVTFNEGSEATKNVTWTMTTSDIVQNRLNFQLDDLSTTQNGDSFVIGSFASYYAKEVTFNGFTSDKNGAIANNDKWYNANGDYYQYNASAGTLTLHTV